VTPEFPMSLLPTLLLRHLQDFPSLEPNPVREVRNVLRRMRKIHARKSVPGVKDESPRRALVKASWTRSSASVSSCAGQRRSYIERVEKWHRNRSKSPSVPLSAFMPHRD
jgi:hypothetical protein